MNLMSGLFVLIVMFTINFRYICVYVYVHVQKVFCLYIFSHVFFDTFNVYLIKYYILIKKLITNDKVLHKYTYFNMIFFNKSLTFLFPLAFLINTCP